MATRLLYISAIRSIKTNPIRYVKRQLLLTTQNYEVKVLPTIQKLHTKTLDKEANWEAQRQTSRYENLAEQQTEVQTPHVNVATSTEAVLSEPRQDSPFITKPMEADDGFVTTDNADIFGAADLNEEDDAGDAAEEEYISSPPSKSQRMDHIKYVRLIKQHLIAKELKQAIEVVEVRMKRDRVKPETYTYNLLISACAKAGYTRKAFSLFTKMRQRGLRVTGGTYTSLLNACANAPSAVDGLGRANHVREIMLEKGFEPNVKNYNAMIKAYGRWGDVKTAYQIADEMKMKNLKLTAETYNFLLQACASDYKFGFRHCLLTWHKMLKSGMKPDYFSFHTVLRCVRDCGFGDLKTMEEVLQQILTPNKETQSPTLLTSAKQPALETTEQNKTNNPFRNLSKTTADAPSVSSANNQFKSTTNTITETSIQTSNRNELTIANVTPTSTDLEIPNLLASQPHLGSMLSLGEVTKPHERFLLLGGITGFLEQMKLNGITPNIQMFTTMLEVIPPTNAAEKQLLSYIRRIGLKADIDFFNVLIKKRAMRFDYEGAKEVLSMVRTAGLEPDIVTYGVLALGCRTQEEARELLQHMREKGIRMNIQILGAMLRQGCSQRIFPYVCEIMQISLDEHIKPNDVFLRHLHNFHKQCARAIDSRHPSTKTKNYKKQHARFCDKLRLYYEEHGIAGLKLDDAIRFVSEGPYKQYKEASVEGLEPLKNEHLVRKQKIRKYIKKIKIENLRGDDENEIIADPKAILTESKPEALKS